MFARNSAAWLLGAGFALLALLLIGTFVVSSSQQRDHAMVAHTLEVQKDIATVEGRLRDAESAQRGYIISGDPRFLEPLDRTLATIDRDLDTLGRATMDNPRQQASMAELRPLVAKRLAFLKRGRDMRRASEVVPSSEFLGLEGGRIAMQQVRDKLAGMSREEDHLLARRVAQTEASATQLRVLLGAGFAFVVLLTLFAVRDAVRRLAEVSASRDALADANAQLLAEGQSRERAEAQLRQVQKMEAVGQLTGGIAHDFNNMLSIVIGSLELARRRLRREPERAEVCIDNAMEGAQRAAGLTARLLAFSRQQPLAPTPIDPNKLVGGMSELLRRTIGEQVRVETVLAGGIWRANIDAQQLENAIINLCVNARDAMPDGGALTIETENAHLDDAYAATHADVVAGQYVMVSITDTGVGMPPEVIERAFDPFYTTKGVGRGTGLGLSQVFGFVKQSGGHVKIYSEVGRGTSVKLYLPRWIGEAADRTQEPPPTDMPRARPNEIVLVVEDEEKVRHVTVDALRDLGYTVVQADSGERAIEALKLQPRIDLLFTDIVMPGMTGRVLAEQVIAARPDLRVLYTTGYTRNAVVHNGVLDPGVAFLPKPFTIDQLARKVRQVLDGVGANRPVQQEDGAER